MHIDLRDGIKDELNTKVTIKLRWIIRIVILSLIIGAVLFGLATRKKIVETTTIENQITELFDVSRGVTDTTYGTYWQYCGGWFTAVHVHTGMGFEAPEFVSGAVVRSPGLIDAAWYGGEWSCDAPMNPEDGMPVYLLGYPGGSDKPTLRQGNVYLRRSQSGSPGYEISTWVVVFELRGVAGIFGEPVVGGMSGGVVTDREFNPVGILVTQNSPSDVTGDGKLQQSADIVGLADAYQALIVD